MGLLSEMSAFWFVDRFFCSFLDNYPAKSDILNLIDTADCWKLSFIICFTHFLLEKKRWNLWTGFQTGKIYESLTVFGSFLTLRVPILRLNV